MDLFINKLGEQTNVKDTDVTVFDVLDTSTGDYQTQKVSFNTLATKIKDDVSTSFKKEISDLDSKIDTANTNIAKKLDKRGLNFNSSEKMSGELYVDTTLTVTGASKFSSTVNVDNNFIQNVKDPVLDLDAVNLQTLNDTIANINIPNSDDFIRKSGTTLGSSMTAGDLTLFRDPTKPMHATTMQWVTGQIDNVNKTINSNKDALSGYLPLKGGQMTTPGFIIAYNKEPTGSSNEEYTLVTKYYVDTKFKNVNGISKTDADLAYLAKAGDKLTAGDLTLFQDPTKPMHATTMQWVTGAIKTATNGLATNASLGNYILKTGDSMSGGWLTLFQDPTLAMHATTMQWVTGAIKTATNGLATNASLGTYVQKAGDTMSGTLKIKGFTESVGPLTASSAGTLNLDLFLGNTFPIDLKANVTGFTTSNLPSESLSITVFITQGTSPFTVAWTIDSLSIKWANNLPPTMTTTAGKTDVFAFTKIGTGTNTKWYGFNGGQAF